MDLNSPEDQYSWFLFKGNIIKEERYTFIAIKALYIICLAIVIVGIVTSVILSIVSPDPEYDSWGLGGFFLTGFLGTIFIITLLVTIKIAKAISPNPPGKSNTAFFSIHAFKGVFFILPAIIGLVASISGETWWVVLPFFLNSGIALIWKFPTRNRWEWWLAERNW